MNPLCIECQEEYNPKRAAIGYRTCLDCGGRIADIEVASASDMIVTAWVEDYDFTTYTGYIAI